MIRKFIAPVLFIIIFLIISCVSTSKSIAISTSTLNGKTFQLTNMFEGRGITISFYNEEFYGYSGFNTYLGEYEMRRGNIIILKNMAVTKMGGTSEAVEIEKQYIELLSKASSIELTSNTLTIITLDDERLEFKRIK
ncbi:META domain-containing protein [Brachyspira alvinipulli]|uniref:META domain-containing protein n=1 Tax=Brachyspira alvinipulli TaxID=84379 RepID=UPI002630CBD2|nr:META domain-containing protein [uncultured Brachyspira sp.]